MLQKWGLSPRAVMELMRHSDLRLSTGTYMDVSQLQLFDELNKLPSPLVQILTNRVKTRENLSKPHLSSYIRNSFL